MESARTGAHLMVKIIFLFYLSVFFNTAHANFSIGVSTNSWQELVPTLIQSVPTNVLTTFSSPGISLGYQHRYTLRFYSLTTASYLAGSADIHKQATVLTPRLKFTSYWLSNKLMRRSTKTFAIGPNLVINNRTLENSSATTSFGLFLDFDFDIFQNTQLTQSFGSMSDSKQLAYSFSLNRLF